MTSPERLERTRILQALVDAVLSPDAATSALAAFSWDSEDELVELGLDRLGLVLQRHLAGEIDDQQLSAWAEAVNGRDDIGYDGAHDVLVSGVLFELSTPELFGPLHELADHARTRIAAAGRGTSVDVAVPESPPGKVDLDD
ncbi:MAG TPA: hypothetical protein VNT31_10605 [Nocardioides sp.]|nr:hypothetical protein [Nocardioides sp.]